MTNRADVFLCVKLSDDGCGCCKCKNYQNDVLTRTFSWLGKLLSRREMKAAVIVAFIGIAAGGIAGISQIEVITLEYDFFYFYCL